MLLFFLISYCWECFMPIRRNLSMMTVFKDKTNFYNMYKIKLHKTSKCLWPIYYINKYFCYEMIMFFFKVFINHLPKILRSLLRKIAIDLLYWDVYDVIIYEKVSYHSKTLLHRFQGQVRLWSARLLFKNNKRNNKHFNDHGSSLYFLMNIF